MNTDLTYFAQPGAMTDPGLLAKHLDHLPTGIPDLCNLVQGITVHIFWADRYGIHLPPERQAEVQLRTLERRLKRMLELDPRPLSEARPLDRKVVGNCRDFTLLLVSILRHQGVPARARCGFGAYFLPNHYEDHWVCEYWNTAQDCWVLVDAQLDAFQCREMKIPFDPLDVPRSQFIVAGRAWQMCRNGQADPESFGIFDMHGMDFIRGNLVRDVAAINKIELLPWDCWGIIESPEPNSPSGLAFLDQLAGLTCGDVPDFQTVCHLYESDERIRMGGGIHSYVNGGMETIQIAI